MIGYFFLVFTIIFTFLVMQMPESRQEIPSRTNFDMCKSEDGLFIGYCADQYEIREGNSWTIYLPCEKGQLKKLLKVGLNEHN